MSLGLLPLMAVGMTRIGHFMILALPGHGWDILPVTRMGHSIPVMNRVSQQ